MSDLKLFQTEKKVFQQLESSAAPLERSLQTLFEENLETLLGVRFLSTEYKTTHGGRMDTVGIDENHCPVIIEYKRDRSENVINQGLFYLDWLVDHKSDLEILVRDQLGKKEADEIEWNSPRLICIAADFTKYDYDMHAVNQMGKNIELVRYRKFGENLLLLELLTATSTDSVLGSDKKVKSQPSKSNRKTVKEVLSGASKDLQNLYFDVETFLLGIGDDVTKKTLRDYFAFRRIRNFACVVVKASSNLNLIRFYLNINSKLGDLEEGFSRSVKGRGYLGTGDLEITIKTHADFEKAKPLIIQSYNNS